MTALNKHAELRKELSNPAIGSKDHLRKLALSLLDELETKDTEIEWMRKRIEELAKALEVSENHRATWYGMADKLGDSLDVSEKRVAELESRIITVKLPKKHSTTEFLIPVPVYSAEELTAALTRQGINVETEEDFNAWIESNDDE